MSARASISGTVHSGRDLGSIVRREYGRHAGVQLSSDPNAPEVGRVVEWHAATDAWRALGTVTWVEGAVGDVEPRR